MGLRRKAKEKLHKVGVFFGVVVDKRLTTALPHMNLQALQQQFKMTSLRLGSASTGFVFNTCMLMYPGFLFGAALNLRQIVVAERSKEMIKQAMEAKLQQASGADQARRVGHVKGTVRYFLVGAGMKAVIFVVFLGHIHAEDFVINHLNPADIFAHLPQGLPVQEVTQALHDNIHEAFTIPHAFNANPIVETLQAIGNAPKEAMLGASQELQSWAQCEGPAQLMHQVAVGPAMEVNVPAMAGERAMEKVAEDWSGRNRFAGQRSTQYRSV